MHTDELSVLHRIVSLSKADLGFIVIKNSKSAGTLERREICSCKSGYSCRSKVGLFHTQGQTEQKLTVASRLSLSRDTPQYFVSFFRQSPLGGGLLMMLAGINA